jgi:hypothetical protein
MTLSGVHDRTGIPRYQLEALEGGALGRFSDEISLLTALRRFADVVGVDAQALAPALWEAWTIGRSVPVVSDGSAPAAGRLGVAEPTGAAPLAPRAHAEPSRLAGAPPAPATFGSVAAASAGRSAAGTAPGAGRAVLPSGAGRLSPADPPGSGMHTTTARVPVVSPTSAVTAAHLVTTAAVPAVGAVTGRRGRRKPPLALRVLVWSTAAALAAAVATLELHRVVPRWVRSVRSFASGITQGTATSNPHGSAPRTGRPDTAKPVPPAGHGIAVTPDPAGTTVTMPTDGYQVVVSDLAPAWISVSAPGGSGQLFSGVLQPGQVRTFTPSGGQLAVVFGGVHVKVTAQVDGKTVPNWSFVPTQAPTTVTFRGPGAPSTTTSA